MTGTLDTAHLQVEAPERLQSWNFMIISIITGDSNQIGEQHPFINGKMHQPISTGQQRSSVLVAGVRNWRYVWPMISLLYPYHPFFLSKPLVNTCHAPGYGSLGRLGIRTFLHAHRGRYRQWPLGCQKWNVVHLIGKTEGFLRGINMYIYSR